MFSVFTAPSIFWVVNNYISAGRMTQLHCGMCRQQNWTAPHFRSHGPPCGNQAQDGFLTCIVYTWLAIQAASVQARWSDDSRFQRVYIGALRFAIRLVRIYQTTRCQVPEDHMPPPAPLIWCTVCSESSLDYVVTVLPLLIALAAGNMEQCSAVFPRLCETAAR